MCILAFAGLVSAQQEQPQGQSQSQQQTPPTAEAAHSGEQPPPKPAAEGPAVDSAKVTGSTFNSAFFKFTYELPQDWKPLDDAVRVAENRKFLDEDKSRSVVRPVPRAKGARSKTRTKNPAFVPRNDTTYERYSLMAASPEGVSSVGSGVLPRMNIWVHKRIPPLDGIGDHAQFLVAMRRVQIVEKPKEVSIAGHKFVRVDILSPSGEYHSQFVTIMGDYLVGFDFLTTSQKELSSLAGTMETVKFE